MCPWDGPWASLDRGQQALPHWAFRVPFQMRRGSQGIKQSSNHGCRSMLLHLGRPEGGKAEIILRVLSTWA